MPTVPTSPATRSAERRPASTRYVVVVLPDVPVTPMTRNFSDGLPVHRGGHLTEHRSWRRVDQHRDVDIAAEFGDAGGVGEDRGGPARHRLTGMAGAVRRGARQGGEQV